MRTWDMHTPAAKLRQAMKDLQVAKARVADEWQDDKIRELDETCIEPLEPRIRGLLQALGELTEVMSRAERVCGS